MGIIDTILTTVGLKDRTLGIAFSGGGARGFSHIGLVLALEKFGLKASVVSGVSAGAVAAAMYGSGMRAAHMRECFAEQSGFSDYREWIVPKQGFMSLRRFENMLRRWLPVKLLQEMPIPTYVCATDLDSGAATAFSEGDAARMVVASCSIPIIFPPIRIGGHTYVDGGVVRNLPAWIIRDQCKVLIGSNCSPLTKNFSRRTTMLSVALRSYALMSKSNTTHDLKMCDIVVQTNSIGRYGTFSIKDMDRIIMAGYDAACPKLEKFIISHQ